MHGQAVLRWRSAAAKARREVRRRKAEAAAVVREARRSEAA